jgi:replication factor C subunit 2/4
MELLIQVENNYKKINIPLVEKYRPKKFEDIILDDFIKLKIKNIINSKHIPNMIITGEHSTGKTSTVQYMVKKLFKHNYDTNILELNASDDRGLNTISTLILPFCKKKTDGMKVIILDEADSITQKAQSLLSNIINEYENNVRFIFICNDRFKINENIQSLCILIHFPKINKNLLKNKIIYICDIEQIKYTTDGIDKLLFYSDYDIRQCINNLECILYNDKKLNTETIEYFFDLPRIEYIKKILLYCIDKKYKNAIDTILYLYNDGYSPNDILLIFMKYILSDDFDINITEEQKLNLYKILSNSFIKVNNGVNSLVQLYGCISHIFNIL